MQNPYLQRVSDVEADARANYDGLLGAYVPTDIRRGLQLLYSWAIPTEEIVREIAALSPIVEIGAGSGYWAWLLEQVGADVVAYDPYPPGDAKYDHHPEIPTWHSDSPQWFNVQLGGAEKLADHGDRTLFLCWPPWDERMGAEVVAAYHAAGGQRVAYIGESQSGCCGDDVMFRLLGDDGGECPRCAYESTWRACTCGWRPLFTSDGWEPIRQWEGMHDGLSIHERISLSEEAECAVL